MANYNMELGDDTIQSDDIDDRIEELEDEATEGKLSSSDAKELKMWKEVKDDAEGYGWEHGVTLIEEYYFKTTYAEEFVRDTAEHPEMFDTLPFTKIDWEAVAHELAWDYNQVDIGKYTYLFLSA